MPLFSRRRLQQMLDEMGPHVRQSKLQDWISRLNDKRFENAIPAEAELAMVWAISKLGAFEAEPHWFSENRRRPEGISGNLISGRDTVFDVKALSDRVRPGNVGMKRASELLVHAANKIRRRAGKHLELFFFERREASDAKRYREPWAARNYKMSEFAQERLRQWLLASPSAGEFVDIVEPDLAVRVTWTAEPVRFRNYRSSGVNEIYDVDSNHIANALREKAQQLKSREFDGARAVFLVDVGCAALKRMRRIDPVGRDVAGATVIQHYLDKCRAALDFVCVFSPQIRRPTFGASERLWHVTGFARAGLELPVEALKRVAGQLPAPRFDGYELESLHDQQLFGPKSRGWYLGTDLTTIAGNSGLKVRFSARALHEFLAGGITAEQLRQRAIGDAGPFAYQLREGNTISDAKLIPGGIDEDDDQIELTFSPDPAVKGFESRSPNNGEV